ncbi:VOC family protein [Pseudemcibacter aquimaris]|uniref:VOC family protein n=1 Tax=Pseudemcibacter aquimaris TaxID=2857064 RepID=UPI0020136C67|nr:VOC family protein [Pseudemcibacter aquimaris]MCC3861948.1 VOC family protein [Pseudemcibacter aquimaris]WDU58700.1 VOC family protein [Pseudemcibacter aquimaris]
MFKSFTVQFVLSLLFCASAMANENKIDHIIFAVSDYDEAIEFLQNKSGIKAADGAIQKERGTRNALLSAGNQTYLEILAPDPAQMPFNPTENPKTAFASVISQFENSEVDMFAYSTNDIDAAKKNGEELGLKVGGPYEGSRTIPSGEVITWSEMEFYGHEFGQFIPFVMNWGTSTHPGTTSPKGIELKEIIVQHPKNEELAKIYKALGVPATVEYGEKPVIKVKLSSKKGDFELTSGESLKQYYASKNEG